MTRKNTRVRAIDDEADKMSCAGGRGVACEREERGKAE